VILLEHLTRRYHDLLAVDDISLQVEEGEVLGFLGPNGAGKSTTIKILTSFLPATSGRAEVAGFDVASQGLAVRRCIGYLPENVAVPPDARVDEYLEYRARLKGLSRADRHTRREAVLEAAGLVPMRRRILSQLSRGYRQRVGLADALLTDPKVLFLDEPTGGLDPAQRADVLELIASLRGRRTVMLSSHVLAEVDTVCSRVAIIKEGRIVAQGTSAELEQQAGRRGEVAIELDGDPAPLGAALEAKGVTARPSKDGHTWVAQLGEDDDVAALLASLVQAGLPVRRFEPLTRSLQQIFLDLTRS
jgi:ABC-2 type transport system ATP-binding protein